MVVNSGVFVKFPQHFMHSKRNVLVSLPKHIVLLKCTKSEVYKVI